MIYGRTIFGKVAIAATMHTIVKVILNAEDSHQLRTMTATQAMGVWIMNNLPQGMITLCSECDSYRDVKAIQWRKGWGKSNSWWPTKEFLCAQCRAQFYSWRYFR